MLDLAKGFMMMVSPLLLIWFLPTIINMVIGAPAKMAKTDPTGAAPDAVASRTGDSVDDVFEEREARDNRREPSMQFGGMPDAVSAVVGVPVANATGVIAGAAAVAGNVYHFQKRNPGTTSNNSSNNSSAGNEVYPPQAQMSLPIADFGAPPEYQSTFDDEPI